MYCKFCKYPDVNFLGNVDLSELIHQFNTILRNVSIDDFSVHYYDNEGKFIPSTDELDIHFSIMGEPTFNDNILIFTEYNLRRIVNYYINAKRIHPVLTTNLPKDNSELIPFLLKWCDIKNKVYEGDADLQFNLYSTSNTKRNELFDERSLTIEEISKIAAVLPKPIGKKYILNFNYNSDTIIDINIINQLFDKNNWIIRIEEDGSLSEWDDSFFDILKLVNNCGWDIEINWRI
jgi:23S rRNA (adenine2503-C2)-methyltransferase